VAGYGVGYRRGVNDTINGSTRGPDHRLDGGFQLHIPTDVRSDACRDGILTNSRGPHYSSNSPLLTPVACPLV
jgi:hypothetical protein